MRRNSENPLSIERFQAYLRQLAEGQYQKKAAPPFAVYLHPQEAFTFFNYAIPVEPAGGDLREALAHLRRIFSAAGREPRFEFLEEFAPGLPQSLQKAGFIEEARQVFMVCVREDYRPVPAPPGCEIETVIDAERAGLFLVTRRQGFELAADREASPEEIAHFTQATRQSTLLLARKEGIPAGTALLDAEHDGIRELNSVSTRPEFRRQGIAAALTAAATGLAFEQGAQAVCLTAADEKAGRVYARSGFRPYATMLAYCKI